MLGGDNGIRTSHGSGVCMVVLPALVVPSAVSGRRNDIPWRWRLLRRCMPPVRWRSIVYRYAGTATTSIGNVYGTRRTGLAVVVGAAADTDGELEDRGIQRRACWRYTVKTAILSGIKVGITWWRLAVCRVFAAATAACADAGRAAEQPEACRYSYLRGKPETAQQLGAQ